MEACGLTYLEFTPTSQTTTEKAIGPYPAHTDTIKIHYNTAAKNQVYVWGEGGFSNAVSFFYINANHIRADDIAQCIYQRK